jgi:hypothetical protein
LTLLSTSVERLRHSNPVAISRPSLLFLGSLVPLLIRQDTLGPVPALATPVLA